MISSYSYHRRAKLLGNEIDLQDSKLKYVKIYKFRKEFWIAGQRTNLMRCFGFVWILNAAGQLRELPRVTALSIMYNQFCYAVPRYRTLACHFICVNIAAAFSKLPFRASSCNHGRFKSSFISKAIRVLY